MRRSRLVVLAAAVAAVLGAARPASADITAFLGFSPTVSSRSARGISAGGGFLIVSFEFEYADVAEDADKSAPGLRTGMANAVLHTPFNVGRFQLYGTAGGGFYKERLGSADETGFAVNVGGGVKIRFAGPLGLRLDYRVFKLRGSPMNDHYSRLYAGLNLGL